MKKIKCKHISYRKIDENPAYHDVNGKEFFYEWQLKCKNCNCEWTEILGRAENNITKDKERAKKYGWDYYPNPPQTAGAPRERINKPVEKLLKIKTIK